MNKEQQKLEIKKLELQIEEIELRVKTLKSALSIYEPKVSSVDEWINKSENKPNKFIPGKAPEYFWTRGQVRGAFDNGKDHGRLERDQELKKYVAKYIGSGDSIFKNWPEL